MSKTKLRDGMIVKGVGLSGKGIKAGQTYTLKSAGKFQGENTFNLMKGKQAVHRNTESQIKGWIESVKSGDKNGLEVVKESYTHYPSLKKLVNVHFTDPRTDEGDYKVHAEIDGPIYNREADEVVNGTYVMYEDGEYPGNYIAVHVSKNMNEKKGDKKVCVVAMDKSKNLVKDRMMYRRRTSNSVAESKLVEGGRIISEFFGKKEILSEE
jgi:hypothetical protein